jgi:hypothetical protein
VPSDDSSEVTLGELSGGAAFGPGFEDDRKNGSLFHSTFRGGGAAGGSAGGGLGLAGVLKICVKLPSPEADPETPGDENPRAGAAGAGLAKSSLTRGGATGLVKSSLARGVCAGAWLPPPTKTLVNSPAPELVCGGAGAGSTGTGVDARKVAVPIRFCGSAGGAEAAAGFASRF